MQAAPAVAVPPAAPAPLTATAVAQAIPYTPGRSVAAESPDELIYPNERSLFPIALVLSIGFWLVLLVGTLGIALFYAAAGFVFYLFAQSGLIAYIKGNAVRITPQQYPDLYDKLAACCGRLGMGEVPETFLLHGNGAFNAFATRFLGRHFLVLYSDVVDALAERPGALNFYLGHELGHVHRGHLAWRPLLLPASFLPLLGQAYSRACESTCDNYGAACCEDLDDAVRGLCALAAGEPALAGPQPARVPDADAGDVTLLDVVPRARFRLSVARRSIVARVAVRGDGQAPEIPGRHPLAYVLALFIPRTMAGAGLASMFVMVAIIGIIAAIAIPSLLRARISANEVSAHRRRAEHRFRAGGILVARRELRPARLPGHTRPVRLPLELSRGPAAVSRSRHRQPVAAARLPWSFAIGPSKPTRANPNGIASYCFSPACRCSRARPACAPSPRTTPAGSATTRPAPTSARAVRCPRTARP